MEAEIGSLEPGKWADFIAVDVSRSHFAPIADPYSALVYGANQDDVRLTVIGGRELYRDRTHVGADADAVRARAVAVREKLQDRVITGAVEVGGADSGWWQAAAPAARREESV